MTTNSNRLRLRTYTSDDEAFFVGLNTDQTVRAYMDGALSTSDALSLFRRILAQPKDRWLIETIGCRPVGHAFVTRDGQDGLPEVGVMLMAEVWGQGFGTEALFALKEILYAQGMHTLVATVDEGHQASHRMLCAAGFRRQRLACDEEGPFWVYLSP